MPNWSYNSLAMYGTDRAVRAFLDRHCPNGKLDFNTFVPYPEAYKAEDDEASAKYNGSARVFGKHGMDWCYDNWGTKWNAHEVDITNNNHTAFSNWLIIKFETAWSPPWPIIKMIVENYKVDFLEIEFDYQIELDGSRHCLRFRDGKLVQDETEMKIYGQHQDLFGEAKQEKATI